MSFHLQQEKLTSQTFFHTLSSRTAVTDEILIVTGYDYFLQKNDLKTLLQKYTKIILVPRAVTDDTYLGAEIGKLLSDFDKIELINNPAYDQQHQIVYQIALKNSKVLRTTTVQEYCEKVLKKIYIPESIADAAEVEIDLHYFSLPIRLIKKTFDWLVGGLLLIASLPLCLFAYFKIKKQSPGPALYRQKRVGVRNDEFECTKFRSMRIDAEKDGAQFSSKNDDRIFPFGKTMRATRIDELPQLFNIVRGEMSLIGPRPERRVFTETFEEQIPHYAQRHVVKPGISGYAQVMYPYGAGLSDARHKLMYDLYYIKNWNLLLEFKVGIMTLWTVVSRGGM